jgi:hypothetical protein
MADFHLKIEWAYKHVDDLHAALQTFIDSEPYTISEKCDPQNGERVYYAARVAPVPPAILLIAGDILQNLRTALDYLICHLVRIKVGTTTTGNGFPIFENVPETKQEQASFARKVEGLWKEPLDVIDRIGPYKGRNNDLWRLHELNIRDKHRLLLTAGAAVWQFNLGQHLRATDRATGLLANATDWWVGRKWPLLVEEGQQLFVDPPDAKVNKDIQFTFQVALNESGVCEGEPLIMVVRQSLNLVRKIVTEFEPYV